MLKVDLGILIALLLTDGSVSKNKHSYSIELTGKSIELHDIFKNEMRRLFRVYRFIEICDSRHKEIKRTIVRNKSVAEHLLSYTTYRTKQFDNGEFPNSKLPNFIFKMNDTQVSKLLQVMFSCDGSISLWIVWNKRWKVWEIKKWVKLACKHPLIRLQVYKLLKKLGFKPIIREVNDEILLIKKIDMIRFSKTIRFVDGVKITKDSKNWEDFEKNKVLDLAVRTFEIRQDELKDFKTKNDIFNYLKSIL